TQTETGERAATSRKPAQILRPSSFQSAIRRAVSAAKSSAETGSSCASSSIQPSTCSAVTSGWNWTPQADSPRRKACVQTRLRAEADSEHRDMTVEQALEEQVLLAQPRVHVVLVGVHRAAEHEHCAVVVERTRQRRVPGEAPFLEPVPRGGDCISEYTRANL